MPLPRSSDLHHPPFFLHQAEKIGFFQKMLAFAAKLWYHSQVDMTFGRLAQLVEHLLDVQEVTGSSPVPSTKTRASDFGQGLFSCVIHQLMLEQDGTGLERATVRSTGTKAPVGLWLARGW